VNLTETQKAIKEKCNVLRDLLLEKNKKYGNSALDPVRVFSDASTLEQLLVRMDDKLSRIKSMGVAQMGDEDTLLDLAGYLVLLMVQRDQENNDAQAIPRPTKGPQA